MGPFVELFLGWHDGVLVYLFGVCIDEISIGR